MFGPFLTTIHLRTWLKLNSSLEIPSAHSRVCMHGVCMVMVNAVSTTTRPLSLTCPDVTDIDDKTPVKLAEERGHTKVADYLKSVRRNTPLLNQVCVTRNPIPNFHTQ